MPVQLICPNLRCRKFLSVPEDVRGKLVKCQHCSTNFRVPTARKAAPAVVARHDDDAEEEPLKAAG